MNNELLLKNIKELCKKENISISQLEKELEFSPSLISRWKDKNPNIDRIIDIANRFNISIDDLVGRKPQWQKSDKYFLSILEDITDNKKIVWNIIDNNTDTKVGRPRKNPIIDPYNEDSYNEVCYFAEYNTGFIIIYCFYGYGKLLNPYELKLYVQPPNQTKYALQEYLMDELKPLWIKILSNLKEVPIEIKSEEFKNSLIKEFISKDSEIAVETIHIDNK